MKFDGIDYIVQHQVAWGGQPERVLVWLGESALVATAVIDHNCEQIFVTIHGELDTETTANYFEYTDPEELASWMVANSY